MSAFFIMDSSQKKKILVLLVFVMLLALSAFFLFNKLVKPSPYYPQKEVTDE